MTGVITRVQGKRKTKVGRVVSDRMDKTIVVSVERLARHPLYKRVIRLTTKFKAHDETNDARIGDTVLIEESRPLSATKRWKLVSIIQRAGEHGLPGESVVAEEAAVTEAIHAAAHPGRTRAAEAEAETDAETGESADKADASADDGTDGSDTGRSEDRGDATASHRSEDSGATS
jgi:small subunit ribosomal protein S17